MLKEIGKDPNNLNVIRKPERLTGNYSGCYSRRITKKDRLVYKIHPKEQVVHIIQFRYHYGDK